MWACVAHCTLVLGTCVCVCVFVACCGVSSEVCCCVCCGRQLYLWGCVAHCRFGLGMCVCMCSLLQNMWECVVECVVRVCVVECVGAGSSSCAHGRCGVFQLTSTWRWVVSCIFCVCVCVRVYVHVSRHANKHAYKAHANRARVALYVQPFKKAQTVVYCPS